MKRKVQLGAAAVIANGLMALSVVHPGVALADSCSEQARTYCDVCLTQSECQSVAPPGCTVTEVQCIQQPFGACQFGMTFCFY